MVSFWSCMGYWAFTFGAKAIASATMRFAARGDDRVFTLLAPPLFVVANLVVVGLAIATVVALLRGRLLPAAAAPAATAAPTLPGASTAP